MMKELKEVLEKEGWIDFADLFTNTYNKEELQIRNCLFRWGIDKNYQDCTPEEILEDKYNRLLELMEEYPKVKETIKSRLL